MSLSGQQVWVLGAGFLGASLEALCRRAGASVLTFDVNTAASPHICADTALPATFERAVRLGNAAPVAIFCCTATHGGSVADYRRCYVGTVQALAEVGMAGRCVFCSSTSLYGGVSERSSVLAEAESLVLQAGGCVARLAPLYGPGRCELLRRHLAGEPCLPGAPDRVLNYVHVEDAAMALLLLAQQAARGIYAVCGESFTKAAIYPLLERLTGVPTSESRAEPSRRCHTSRPVDAASLRALGWTPQHFFADFVASQLV